jgi:hypothetical protein
MNLLSKMFQGDKSDYEDALSLVKATKRGLKALYISPLVPAGTTLKTILRSVPTDAFDGEDDEVQFEFPHSSGEDLSVSVSKSEYESVILHIKLYASALDEELTDRFPNEALNEAFRIFTPNTFPSELGELDEYGEESLKVLLSHYEGAIVSGSEQPLNRGVLEEWENMKFLMHDSEAWNYESFDSWWDPILDSHAKCARFPQLLFFVRVRKVLPLATACCERGFSTMGFVKTEEKTRMGTDVLSSRMFTYLNGPDVSDHAAVHKLVLETFKQWDKMKLRRPECSHVGPRTKKKRDGMRDARAVLAGTYDLSDDEDVSDPEVEDPAPEDVDEDSQEEVCTHDFVPPAGVLREYILFDTFDFSPCMLCVTLDASPCIFAHYVETFSDFMLVCVCLRCRICSHPTSGRFRR